MKQDIVPIPIQPRGQIRPPERPDFDVSRRATYRPERRALSMDGINERLPKSTLTVRVTEVTAQGTSPAEIAQALIGLQQEGTRVIQDVIPQPAHQEAHEATPSSAVQEESSHLAEAIDTEAHPKRHFDIKTHAIVWLAVAIVIFTGYVGVDTWITNRQAQALLSAPEPTTRDDTGTAWSKDDEGKEEAVITKQALSDYSVAPDYPRALYIDTLDIAARVLPMSVHKDGSIQSPVNIFDAGWYSGSVKPGQVGAAFIDGHASGATREGLFAYLDTLVEGDTLQVEKGSGERLTYKVVHTEKVALNDIDMKKVLLPHGNTLKGLNLMTCTGKWVSDKATYDHRVVVYTALVE